MIKDSTANLTSIVGMSMSMLDIEMVLTVAVLISALILNISRLITLRKQRQKSQDE